MFALYYSLIHHYVQIREKPNAVASIFLPAMIRFFRCLPTSGSCVRKKYQIMVSTHQGMRPTIYIIYRFNRKFNYDLYNNYSCLFTSMPFMSSSSRLSLLRIFCISELTCACESELTYCEFSLSSSASPSRISRSFFSSSRFSAFSFSSACFSAFSSASSFTCSCSSVIFSTASCTRGPSPHCQGRTRSGLCSRTGALADVFSSGSMHLYLRL